MKGLVHIYTGDGKGKTTAAVGLAIRAVGNGLKVCFISFHKNPKKYGYGEYKVLSKLENIKVYNFVSECPLLDKNMDIVKVKKEIVKKLEFIKKKIFSSGFDLVILDEILIAIREKFVSIGKVIEIIKAKPDNTEVVLTGQMNKKILFSLEKCVDYITYCKKIKHPYDKGVLSRKGIEC